jgi:predicted nucleotidyltransferase
MAPPGEKDRLIFKLREYLETKEEVVMAFLFGSWAKNQEGLESDLDVGVYFRPKTETLEWQSDSYYESEKKIWMELEQIADREIDLLVLNRAPATVADAVLRGIPIVIKDQNLYMDYLLRITSEAIDFRACVEDYWRLKEEGRNGVVGRK